MSAERRETRVPFRHIARPPPDRHRTRCRYTNPSRGEGETNVDGDGDAVDNSGALFAHSSARAGDLWPTIDHLPTPQMMPS